MLAPSWTRLMSLPVRIPWTRTVISNTRIACSRSFRPKPDVVRVGDAGALDGACAAWSSARLALLRQPLPHGTRQTGFIQTRRNLPMRQRLAARNLQFEFIQRGDGTWGRRAC